MLTNPTTSLLGTYDRFLVNVNEPYDRFLVNVNGNALGGRVLTYAYHAHIFDLISHNICVGVHNGHFKDKTNSPEKG